MFSLLRSIFSLETRGSDSSGEAIIQAATERAVEGTDPRLRALGNYKKKMHAAVACSVEYVFELIDALPPAIEISRKNFCTDSRLRAFFVSTDHLQEVIGASQGVRDYLQMPAGALCDPIYCLLSLDRSEKNVFGMELQGEVIKRDVSQAVVNFSHHRLVALSRSEAETRWELKKRAFDHLVEMALQGILSARARGRELKEQRILLRRKLDAMKAGRWGLEVLLEPTAEAPPDLAAIEGQIAGIEAELFKLGADSMTLESYLTHIVSTLSRPQEHLRLDRVSLTLDAMGIKRTGRSGAGISTLLLDEAVGGNRRRVVLLGYIPRADVPPPRDVIEEVSRFLSSR